MTQYVYPGSFSPPTYAHLNNVKRAASLLPNLKIVCSTNEDKHNKWFSEEESATL